MTAHWPRLAAARSSSSSELACRALRWACSGCDPWVSFIRPVAFGSAGCSAGGVPGEWPHHRCTARSIHGASGGVGLVASSGSVKRTFFGALVTGFLAVSQGVRVRSSLGGLSPSPRVGEVLTAGRPGGRSGPCPSGKSPGCQHPHCEPHLQATYCFPVMGLMPSQSALPKDNHPSESPRRLGGKHSGGWPVAPSPGCWLFTVAARELGPHSAVPKDNHPSESPRRPGSGHSGGWPVA